MIISDLTADNTVAIEHIAKLLISGFRDTGSASWRTMEDAIEEVQNSLQPNRISRFAVDEQGTVLGWIGGIEMHPNNLWELHPLVVRHDSQTKGVGRALVADFEQQVAARGAHTVWLGTDDENARTSLGGVDLYPNVLEKLRNIENVKGHPFEFYQKVGYHIVGVIPDASGFGRHDILMAKKISR